MTSKLPAIDDLRKLLDYHADTGTFFWKERTPEFFKDSGYGGAKACASRWNARNAGRNAFMEERDGYKRCRILGKTLTAHRVAWAMETGSWPVSQIDHINLNRSDNRIKNLREASNLQNSWNKGISIRNTSGYKGVSLDKSSGKWIVTIRVGQFDNVEDAAAAYASAASLLRGDFARLK